MINISLTDLLNAPDSAPVAPTRTGDAAAFTGLLDQFDSRQQAEAPAKPVRARPARTERPAVTRDHEPAKDTHKASTAQTTKAKPAAAPARDDANKTDDQSETQQTAAADKPAASDDAAKSAPDESTATVDATMVQAPVAAPIEEQPALQIAMTANSAATADDAVSGVAAPTDQAAEGQEAAPLAALDAEADSDSKTKTPAAQPQTAKAADDAKPAQPTATANAQATDMTKRLDQMPAQIAVQVSGEDAGKPLKPLAPLANGMSHPAQTDATATTQTAAAAPATDATAAPTTAAIDTPDAQAAAQTLTQSATPAFASLVEAAADKTAPAGGKPVAGEPAAIGSVAASGPAAPASGAQAAAQAAKPAPLPHPVTEQVAVHIAKASADGSDKINVKLKPASLGQVDVQLDIAADGRVQVVISADRADTLDLLQRDARGLERALNDAGLQMDQQSMSFNLRDQGMPQGNAGNGTASAGWKNGAESADETLPAVGGYLNARAAVGGLDIRV